MITVHHVFTSWNEQVYTIGFLVSSAPVFVSCIRISMPVLSKPVQE